MIENINIAELDSLHKKNGEILDCNEWNKLVSIVNYVIQFYNSYPKKLSEFENDIVNQFIGPKGDKGDKGDTGETGPQGPKGKDGSVSFEELTEEQREILRGPQGELGVLGEIGPAGLDGSDGKSAYDIAVENGYEGTILQWLQSLVGSIGKSAYELYLETVEQGETPLSLSEWLDSLKGADGQNGSNGLDGQNGKSAYLSYLDTTSDDPVLTEVQWIASLHGLDGSDGADGQDGTNGVDGVTPHIDSTTGNWFIGSTDTGVHAQGPAGLDGTVTGSQAQADWNQTDSNSVDFIKNKPSIPTKISNLQNDSNFLLIPIPDNPNVFVDMGLPSGTLWATCDIDVTKPNRFCDTPFTYEKSFFSWGNIDGHNPINNSAFSYDWGGVNGSEPYYEGQPYGSTPGNTLTGNIAVGEDFDAARANLGAPWRMPTKEEYIELFDNIIYIDANGTEIDNPGDKRVEVNGVLGIYILSKINGERLFFSCSGEGGRGSLWSNRGSHGYYWSSTIYNIGNYGQYLLFYNGSVSPDVFEYRFYGFAVRAVLNPSSLKASTVALTGSYNDLSNKPTIPDALIQSDWNLTDSTAKDFIKNKPGIGIANGLATLDSSGKVPSSQLPSYVDDVIEGYNHNNKFYSTYTAPVEGDDAALAAWGEGWRIPTKAEFQALINATNNTWTADYQSSGVSGLVLTDNTDSSKVLFFPEGDFCYDGKVRGMGSSGEYWSSSLLNSLVKNACLLGFDRYDVNWGSNLNRYYGCNIRPVLASGDSTRPYVEIDGVKWATMNLGANSVTDTGLYYQWGDTQGYTASQVGSGNGLKAFSWTDYKYCDGTDSVMTKYNSTDGLTTLTIELPESYTNELTAETSKIYLDTSTNCSYRWSGTAYVLIGSPQTLSDWNESNTSSPAYIANKPTIPVIWSGTQAQYDALSSYDSNTIYIITSS